MHCKSMPRGTIAFSAAAPVLCRFVGCMEKACELCANNPNKACGPGDNFDSSYADTQVGVC